MAVITKYFVVRNGVELDKIFEVKKEAEAYDNMLDAAEKLAILIRQGELSVEIDEKVIDEISICLAKNSQEVTKILKGVRPLPSRKPTKTEPASDEPSPLDDKTKLVPKKKTDKKKQ